MEDRIFLGKYRVPTTKSPQWWETQRGVTCQGEEVAGGKTVVLELARALLLGEREREARRGAAREVMQIRHANLPALYEFGEEGEHFVYVTEHVQGLSARAWVDAHGPLPIATALGVVLQAADALAVAGRYQIHHAALHPDSLLIVPGQINEDGWPLVKMLPLFGGPEGALPRDASNPRIDAAAAAFASPEEIAGAPADFRSEFYALGAILWFLLSAKVPDVVREGTGKKRAFDLEASAKFAGAPESVRRLLARMLAEDREARPPNRMALEKEIRACLSKVNRDEMLTDSLAPGRAEPAGKHRIWPRLGMRFLATAGAAAMLAIALSGISRTTTGNRSAEASVLPEESPRSVVAGAAAKKAGPEESGSLPEAMNFAVTPPSYQSAGQQLRALRRFPGTAVGQSYSRSTEPEPPGEGPVVELGTEKKRAQPTKVAEIAPPVMISPKGDVHSRKRPAPPARN
jgi:hypothetical protein